MEPTSSSADADERALRVLAAEDNKTNREVVSTILTQAGIHVEFAQDGIEAVATWRAGAFDLVLMDIGMPKMNGVEATRAIRKIEREEGRPHTPIVALTAETQPHQIAEQLAAGVDVHVGKPIRVTELFAAMTQAIDIAASKTRD